MPEQTVPPVDETFGQLVCEAGRELMFWPGFLIGSWLGCIVGVLTMAILIAGKGHGKSKNRDA